MLPLGIPIDILATGTPEHLRLCIDYCEEKTRQYRRHDGTIFGTPGLVTMFEMYDVLHEKMQTCKKPIFPILPSINTAGAEVAAFLAKGHVNFADEVTLGTALSRIVNVPKPAVPEIELFGVDVPRIRRIIDSIPENGYIAPNYVQALLHAAGIPLVDEFVSDNKEEIVAFARRCGFPVVAKVVGPVHKSDVGGVVLNIKGEQHLALEFDRMMQIPDARAIMVQPMLKRYGIVYRCEIRREVRSCSALRFGRYFCGGAERCVFRFGSTFLRRSLLNDSFAACL